MSSKKFIDGATARERCSCVIDEGSMNPIDVATMQKRTEERSILLSERHTKDIEEMSGEERLKKGAAAWACRNGSDGHE